MSRGRDNHLWLQFWRDQRSDFHQHAVNSLLIRFWQSAELAPGSRVFVPLCGKSLDLLWLAQQGHEVIGVELSPIAVQAFFSENNLAFSKRQRGQFTLWQSERISILCGDYFSLRRNDIGPIDTVYDRSALTALPADIRKPYAEHQHKIIGDDATIFLLTVEDAAASDTLAQALGIDREIQRLYGDFYAIELAYVESIVEADEHGSAAALRRVEYKLYKIVKK